MAVWGLVCPKLVRRVFPPSLVLRVIGCVPGVQGHVPIIHRALQKGGNGIAIRVKQRHVAYRGEICDAFPCLLEIYSRIEFFPKAEVGTRLSFASVRHLKTHLPSLLSDKITEQHAV